MRSADLRMASLLLALAAGCGESPPPARLSRVAPELAFPPRGPRGRLSIRAQPAFATRTFLEPVYVGHAPDDGERLFVVERAGRVLAFPADDDAAPVATFLDLRDRVSTTDRQEGLLGLAFAPDFATGRRLWVSYTAADPLRLEVVGFRAGADGRRADPASARTVLSVPQPSRQQNGGMLAFGPDGMLYVGLGDGSAGDDAQRSAQDLGSLLGKILRLDVRAGDAPYRVPADNPFVGRSGARPEIWAYGFRNPWRFSFDAATGALWCGDVGESARDEIDRVVRGGNHGWSLLEGSLPRHGTARAELLMPVHEYRNPLASAVIGGHVYRGAAIPALRGAYVYGDHVTGMIHALALQDGRALGTVHLDTAPTLTSIGTDRHGELLFTEQTGKLRRLARAYPGRAVRLPARLSATGLFTDIARGVAAPGVHRYELNAPAWRGPARVQRWISMREWRRIDVLDDGSWRLPRYTVLVQQFALPARDGRPPRRIETRLLIREDDRWAGYSYVWNAAGSDAELDPGAGRDLALARDAGGRWRVPSRAECARCHDFGGAGVLGVHAAQLARPIRLDAGRTVDQLALWRDSAMFRAPLLRAPQPLADPHDERVSLDARVRADLAVNCAPCHRPGGSGPLDLRPGFAVEALDRPPAHGALGIAGARVVAPGDRQRSALWQRLRRHDGARMPPMAGFEADADAVERLGRWLDAMR